MGAANPGFVDYGPKVYGMGAKNPLAFPPNPFVIQRAVAIANSVPNVLVVSSELGLDRVMAAHRIYSSGASNIVTHHEPSAIETPNYIKLDQVSLIYTMLLV